jgi:hypothetical protein
VLKETGGAPGIFRRNYRDEPEHPERPQRDILQVADGSGDHIQRPGHVERAEL